MLGSYRSTAVEFSSSGLFSASNFLRFQDPQVLFYLVYRTWSSTMPRNVV
jgi:hypothetical protein